MFVCDILDDFKNIPLGWIQPQRSATREEQATLQSSLLTSLTLKNQHLHQSKTVLHQSR